MPRPIVLPSKYSANRQRHSDVFSLGALCYHLWTAQAPFAGRNNAALATAVLADKPLGVRELRPELPASAARIINLTLKKRRAERFTSAADMAHALKEALLRDVDTRDEHWPLDDN